MKSNLKAALRYLLALAIVCAVFVGALYFFLPAAFYANFYHGERLKGVVNITLDGESVPLSDWEVHGWSNNSEELNTKVSGNSLRTTSDTDGYCNFIAVYHDTELRFYVEKSEPNELIRFDMDFDVDTANKNITYSGWIMYPSKNREKLPVSGNYSLEYEHHSIGVYIHE